MSDRFLFPVEEILDGPEGPESRLEILRNMCDLADEMNSRLADYRVRLVHEDTMKYLEFIKEEWHEILPPKEEQLES